MKKYTEITVGGETIRKHRRDIAKDALSEHIDHCS